MTQRVVIVGASLGGLRAAEQLRASGFDGEIVVVGDEPHMPYNRPPLSKEVLSAGVSHDAVAFPLRSSVADVTWRLGSTAVAASLAEHVVHLDDRSVEFDGLVVATGLRPRRLPGPMSDWRHVVRTLDDATRLRACLTPGTSVIVAGAGFIGCEVAATAAGLGCSVTVVAPEAVPMERPLGLELGAALRRRHETHGVRFLMGRLVASLSHGSLELDDGSVIRGDVLIEALGSHTNVEWLAGNDLDLSNGVLCDNWMRVRPHVVAVGDVARFPNPLFDATPRRVEHWCIPTDTAKRAAPSLHAALSGTPLPSTVFAPMPTFWSDQYGFRLKSFGAPDLGAPVVLEGDLDDEAVVGYYAGERLVGVASIGMMNQVMAYRAQIIASSALSPV